MKNLSVEFAEMDDQLIAALNRELASLREENLHLRDQIFDFFEVGNHGGEVKYVGTPTKSLFHCPSCKWVRDIDPKKLVSWSSHEAAVRAGRKPCKTCRA